MNRDFWVGTGIAGFALILLTIIIPLNVVTPKAVRAIVLSPVFWPNILSILLAIGGLMLALLAWQQQTDSDSEAPPSVGRLLTLFVMMPVYIFVLPILGMVPASILAFLAFLFLAKSKRITAGLITALLLPFILYAFFYHVAGVAIPQGQFVVLP